MEQITLKKIKKFDNIFYHKNTQNKVSVRKAKDKNYNEV
jgi:hypothetical protein